ncbi:hypothetical protein Agub_g1045 [Astrephomene gubernaculifera]|uniref:Fibrocystin-L n=1 Tax=Astrephomene gubernaculifera TaxID=47775 RepID=A0AAD3DGX9_9CHLO|nr:hypothetical protein Agub_g1045 [Astrephomene gubernaculifera]
MPASGGLVSVDLAGIAQGSSVTSMYLLPYVPSYTNYTALSAAFAGRTTCDDMVVAADGSSAACNSTAMPSGRYHVLVVMSSGLQLLSGDTVVYDLFMTSVSPSLGSIGGGTLLVITGGGFSTVVSENVVFLSVPVSTTFINGLVECIGVAVTPTQLTCRTQPHLATNADADDPNAKDVMPVATAPAPVVVVLCNANYNTTLLRQYCWSLQSTAHSRCVGGPCTYGYDTALTPAVAGISPSRGFGGSTVAVSGVNLQDITVVEFMQGGVVRGVGRDVAAFIDTSAGTSYGGHITCVAPDLPAGVYTIRLKKANGEMSVDPLGVGVFTYTATIAALSGNAGSLAGGLPLVVTVGGTGLATGNATANTVTISGLPCPVLSMDNATQLTCLAPGINGYVYAEYWNLAVNTFSMPNVLSFSKPDLARLEKGIAFEWTNGSPLLGTIQADYFAARYTFYLQIDQPENVTFLVSADDAARLYIDDVLLGSQGAYLNTLLTVGVHKVVVTYTEYAGYASVKLSSAVVTGSGALTFSALEWQKVTPFPPGVALPVVLTVNGVAADPDCPITPLTLRLPNQPQLPAEPAQVTLPQGACAYVYTSYRTPTLTAVRPTPVSGLTQPSFIGLNTAISIYGNFLVDPSSGAGQISVTIANQSCAITDFAMFNATTNTTRITCTAPAVPAGTWPVRIAVADLGLTRPTASATTDMPVITYSLKVVTYNSPSLSSPITNCQFSMFGGGTLNISGYGFVRGLVDSALQRNMTALWDSTTCTSTSTSTPTCEAATSGRLNLTAAACDGPTAVFRLSRFTTTNPQSFAGNNSAKATLRYKPRVYSTGVTPATYVETQSAEQLQFCGGRTPALSNISPATVAPDVGAAGAATLSLTWYLAGVGSNNNTIMATAAGSASNATVEFASGPTLLPCSSPVVTSSTIGASTYTESVSCTLPAYMPASNYTLWLCIQPFGCGFTPVYSVPLTVSSAGPSVGSSAGGIPVTITGKGFDTNAALVSIRFGNSTCRVVSSSPTSVTCVTGALVSKPVSPIVAPLSITPTIGASEITYPGLTFTFDPSLESTLLSITPARGSTEGGTPVTLKGSNFLTGVATTVTVGETACGSVVVVNDTTIQCTTGKPPSSVLRVPLPVTVYQEGRGNARSLASYKYIDLWSRNSTWGGGALPGYGDSVMIPSGVTVLLDMSPPKLYMLVLEGNLEFDDTQPYINLQAHYILVKGGNFTIGSTDKPYPGRANITMHGLPDSLDLPMYGAKSLGVRQGVVTFFGQPKVPVYTVLNRTVDPGATSITVNGMVNWQIGDKIVIASSSFMPDEVDEAAITGLDNATIPGCTIISLDTPMQYTHLGEVHKQAGAPTPLDMRAEVAVLTRNIVLQGDYDSAKYMYGVQVMVNSPSYLPRALVRFDNVEITQSGQAFRLGRYSMHWHMHGDVAFQSWVRGCSIHHTYNRAITIHGTHHAIIQNTVAYNTMGHTFFLEDGIESGNLIENNIAIYGKASDALLISDTTPAQYWITNPNNTVRNNVATGSEAYGYWYRMLDNPDGPSTTTTVCPKFTPLLEFTNNTAHSNQFYGFRIHPEYYPRNVPCNAFSSPFSQQPAVFRGFRAYKNGVKGFIGTQMGLVQLVDVVMGDNGGGPRSHIISGKDNGANWEISWVTDDRDRYDVALTQMAGLFNATLYARTTTGMHGTAGQWPSDRRITGIIAQSPVLGDSKHSALMTVANVTFVDYTPSTGANIYALEHCGKCKAFQGGATCFTSNLTFVSADGSRPALSNWTWGHQGIFLDTDGSLINNYTLPLELLPGAAANWTYGPGATLHSAVDNELFDPSECFYMPNTSASPNGVYCSPALTFRRVMLNDHQPEVLTAKNLVVVSLATNRSSRVHQTHYNEDGYQFTVATGRDYWLQWDMPYRLDPVSYTLHKMDLMDVPHFVHLTNKIVQVEDHFTVNGQYSNLTSLPAPFPNTTHGSFYYNKSLAVNSWWWGNTTYNDTKFTVFVAGRSDKSLQIASFACPDGGCSEVPDTVVDIRAGTLLWSDASTWTSRGNKPKEGENVTIPYGWDLIIDESPPLLQLLVIQGSVRFDPTKNITLTATYIVVMGQGSLRAGNASTPHPTVATIVLNGTRDNPDLAIDKNLNLGSKVLAAISGGTIELFGRQVQQRWTRLNTPAVPNDTSITVSNPNHGWRVGDKVLIASTSYNVWQTEIRSITAILGNGATLQLDSPLRYPHGAVLKAYPGGPTVDMRAEVGLLSSNILITAIDGPSTHAFAGEYFGARMVVSGNSTGRFNNIAMEYCGQAGLTDRACVFFDRLASVRVSQDNSSDSGAGSLDALVSNPSFLRSSALVWGLYTNVRVGGVPKTADPVEVSGNVMFEAYDMHSVDVDTTNNTIRGNLVLGTIKEMGGKSTSDTFQVATFNILSPANWVEDNVAGGSERYGYTYYGTPCSASFLAGSFRNNTAHSSLAGMWLRASNESLLDGCTAVRNFTTYMNWDFGIISIRGIATDVLLENVNVLDNKHAGVTILRLGNAITDVASARWQGGLLAGQSSPDVCSACATLSDVGCHKKLSLMSYNQDTPFTPAVGLQSAQFNLFFADGPERKPYDMAKGYPLVHGMFNVSGVTLADFYGKDGCGGSAVGTYALSNHQLGYDVFYPHLFSNMNIVNVSTGASQGLVFHNPADPNWRNERDCYDIDYTRPDGSVIPLNCAGPKHVYWRDLDGSLFGNLAATSTIAGAFHSGPRTFPMDQGTPVLPGPCTYSSVLKAYSCIKGSTSFLLDERLKPNPIPATGIFGDPQHFVLESRDKDAETRNFSPVFFNVSGSIDLGVPTRDYGCCFSYGCQKRLSTFWTYLPSGQTVYITFQGTPAQNFRLWFPYADPDKEIVVVINYVHTVNRRYVYLAPGSGPYSGRVAPQNEPVRIGDGLGHGAYYWDQNNTLLYVKLMGGMSLEIRTESAVLISQSFALTVDQFYSTAALFLANLANVMGVDLSRLYIAKIVPGSSMVTTGITPPTTYTEPLAEASFSQGTDPGDPLPPSEPASSPPPPASYSNTVLADLVSAVVAYNRAVSDPDAASTLGVAPLGPPVTDVSGLSGVDATLAAAVSQSLEVAGIKVTDTSTTTASPPPSSPPPPPSPSEVPLPPSPAPPSPSMTLYWSDVLTWTTLGGKPTEGDNVTIPYGWDLVIDESPPPLQVLTILGNVRFDPTQDITLIATHILVMGKGALRAGTPSAPHPSLVNIQLNGSRDIPVMTIEGSLLGSKTLAAILGGTIDLHGRQVGQRWTRLNTPALPDDTSITVSNPNHGWRVGDKVLIASTTYNVWQTEIRSITAILDDDVTLQLDSPLLYPHGAVLKAYPDGPTVDMRAEVGLLSSTVTITGRNDSMSEAFSSDLYGARVVVSGNSVARFSGVTLDYCGQAGAADRACILFDQLGNVRAASIDSAANANTLIRNPSILRNCALVWGVNSNVRVTGGANSDSVDISGNVLFVSYDSHSVDIATSNNTVKGNLVLGTMKEMSGNHSADVAMPSSFNILSPANWVEDNVAGGSERYGYTYYGTPCSASFLAGSFRNNTAHSCLAGMWLRASNESLLDGCTAVRNFTTYMNWDFGLISARGIPTHVLFQDVNVLDVKHSGVTILRSGSMWQQANVRWHGGLLAGQSHPDVCSACSNLTDMGCHPKPCTQSFNIKSPFTPAVGLQSAQFALGFTVGPEAQPWDEPTGYALVHGNFNITGVTLADFPGPNGCGGTTAGAYALANHPAAPDAFHPHFFSGMNVVNVGSGSSQGLFLHTPPNPTWRTEARCGVANYTRPDGSSIPLNCAGPAHVYWRDLDGSLLSDVGAIAGIFAAGPRTFPMDQGTPVLPGPCSYSAEYMSYNCTVGSSAFLLDEQLKPSPIPTSGIFGDPQHFVLESRDNDTESRNCGPVLFNVSGSIDLVTSSMNRGSCVANSTCVKRLSTFWTYLPSGQTVYVNFTGTPPRSLRMWYPYADPGTELVVVLNYPTARNRKYVYVPSGNGNATGGMTGEAQPVSIGDGTGHGANYWDGDSAQLYVKVTGGKSLEVRTESALLVSQAFTLTVDQFYATSASFLTNLAAAMGIDARRMYITKVVPGSTVVTTSIGAAPSSAGDLPEPAFSAAVSPSPSRRLAASTSNEATDLYNAVLAFQVAMSNSAAASTLGVTPLGSFSVDIGLLSSTDTTLAQAVSQYLSSAGITVVDSSQPSSEAKSTDSTPPPPSPTVSPSLPTDALPNIAPAASPGTADGSTPTNTDGSGGSPPSTTTSPSPSPSGGSSSTNYTPIIAGVVIACAVVGMMIAAAVIVVKRRSTKRTHPEPPSEVQPPPGTEIATSPRGSGGSASSNVREAFMTTSPAKQQPTEHAQLPSTAPTSDPPPAPAPLQQPVDVVVSPGAAPEMPRSPSLAAGVLAPSRPVELIRPLVSTHKQPHSAPLVPAVPLGPPVSSSRTALPDMPTKAPAELKPSSSSSRSSGPSISSQGQPVRRTDSTPESAFASAPAAALAAQAGERSAERASSGNGGHSGSAPQAPREPAGLSALEPECPAEEKADDAVQRETPGGETQVVPVQHTLTTQDSIISHPKQRPGSKGNDTASSGSHELRSPGPDIAQAGQGAHPDSRRPTMLLPGGMVEFEASPSLLRSEVAALMLAAGGATDGLMRSPHAAEGEAVQASGASMHARSPAGLHSDSMRKLERMTAD